MRMRCQRIVHCNWLAHRLVPVLVAVLLGCPASAPNWECNGDDPCPSGQTCHALDGAEPRCFAVCNENDALDTCADPSHACLVPGICVPFSGSCTETASCPNGWYCNTGSSTCARKLIDGSACDSDASCESGYCSVGRLCCSSSCGANGEPCTSPVQCLSGYCVDSQCCSGPCGSPCEHCVAGACEPLDDGEDPNDAECPGGPTCNGARACWARTLGELCDTGRDDQCASGFCVDGRCCNQACLDACRQCDTAGACVPVINASDPGTCSASNASGDCPIGSVCECDSAGACKISAAEPCSEGINPSPCPNGWPCLGEICCASDCTPNTCRSCNSDQTGQVQGECADVLEHSDPRGDCSGQLSCDGAGSCYNKATEAPCSSSDECVSTWCVDGYCCAQRCDELCYACNGLYTSANPGTCAAIDNGQDPANECPGGAACQGGGVCWDQATSMPCNFDHQCIGGVCSFGFCAAIAQIAAGNGHTCALFDTGVVKCWGLNSTGQLGVEDIASRGDGSGEMGDNLPAVSLGTGRIALAIATGAQHTCARLDNNEVKCWGRNDYGQLGQGDTNHRGDAAGEMGDNLLAISLGAGRSAVAIAAGGYHTCALLDNNQVKCWGRNFYGQLGLGNTSNRGDASGEMGDSLPYVSLGTGRSALEVALGSEHTCARLNDNRVKCWGSNGGGALGQGDTNHRGDAAAEMGDSLPTLSLGAGRTALQVVAGANHTCARLDNGQAKCWGLNSVGQLGLGDTSSRGDASGEMGDSLPTVDLGLGRAVVEIATKGQHACVRLDDGLLKCWGDNTNGRLGLGDSDHRGDAADEMGDILPPILLGTGRSAQLITAGVNHSCAYLDNGQPKCWGQNSNGQLGLGDTSNRGDGPNEMGDNLPRVDL